MRKLLAHVIKQNAWLYAKVLNVYYTFFDRAMSSSSFWIYKILPNKSIQVVQIGSNDGKNGDPLFHLIRKRDQWKCLFVEPVPYIFDRLKQNYGQDKRFTFENAAITEDTQLKFYWVDPKAQEDLPDLPYWFDQLGSFKRDNIVKHLDGKLAPYIKSQDIQGMTLSTLFSKHSLDRLQLLHVDTEGWDWQILSQLDLDKYQPAIILFEYIHLDDEELKASKAKFVQKYYMLALGGDYLCISKSIVNTLSSKQQKYIKHSTYEE